MRNAYLEILKGRDLDTHKRRCDDNIKMDLQEIGCETVRLGASNNLL
jgi:hypothetical protein